ncbi:MAG: UbiA family prenyltransferase [Anaerolineaceae bacterium]|nr:UbiA family prenyltransferase [Anaerolineaceae bacterium]
MIRLFRPELPLAAGICVTTGQILAAGRFPSLQVGILGFLSVFALSGAALILNDYFDYEVDKINHPDRPLPSGAVSRREVIGLTIATTLVGLTAAAILGLDVLLISIPIWLIGVLYNWRYKKTGLPGNLMVCTSVAATFIFGAVTVNAPWNGNVWVFSLMAFFIDLGEEIAGDAMDMEGDKKINSKSIALRKGKPFALRVTVVMWSVVVLLSLVPAFLGWMGTVYLAAILIIDGVLIYFSIRLLKSQTPEAGRRAMRGAYLGATLGVIAFVLGQFLS